MARSMFNNANLTASTRTANIMAGDVNEFVEQDSIVTVYQISSASGVKVSAFADSDILIDDKEILAIGTSLLIPDHMVDSFAVAGGSRLAIFLRETAAVGTTDVLTAVDIQPL